LRDLGGFLGYLAIGILIVIWLVGWLGICLLAGQFFDLPEKTTAVIGAVLGPLGVLAVIYVGLAARSGDSPSVTSQGTIPIAPVIDSGDPFL
jgi:Kef-type K+ transport system membrane component KefB